MKYFISSDIPGRLRLRYGRNVFTGELESAVEAYFSVMPFVSHAKASHETGSVLLQYTGDGKNDLLILARDLRFSALTALAPSEEDDMRRIDQAFQERLVSVVCWKIIRRYLFPPALRQVFTVIRALQFLKKGWGSIRQRRLTVEVLDAAAIGASMAQGNFNTASNIMFLLGISDLLEEYTMKKTKSLLSSSLIVHADTVWIEQDGAQKEIPMAELKVGDHAVVRTGSTIPVDGVVRKGEAVVNQAAMTGEPLGVFKKSGNSVFAGTVVEDGSITIEVRALGSDSRISQIVDMISESEQYKASIQGKAERIADRIVGFNFLLSFGVFAVTRNVTKAVSVLLVDFACALKLATPISVISAMREASTRKIVVKGGKFFEAIAEADTIVFDKTGTLTIAQPKVSKVVPLPGYERSDVFRLAACMEEHFPHSVARAIVRAAKEENLRHEEEHAEVKYIVAHGIATTIYGKKAIIGSPHFVFEDEGVPLDDAARALIDQETGSDSAIFLAVEGKLTGFICISDPPRPEATETLKKLRALGIKETIMLTGDSEGAARTVSKQLGIDRYHAQILPQDKADIIEKIKKEGRKVIMVGDGINDSPALAAADVSISLKDSSDIAREVSDITLLSSDLSQIITVRELGQALMSRIQSNFNFIVAFNTSLLLLGLGNVLTPGTTALLHNASTIAVSAASTRPCLKGKPKEAPAEIALEEKK